MQTSQPVGSPLGLLLLIAMIYIVVKSPKKLQTLGRMGIAFVLMGLLIMAPAAILRRGDPEAIGAIAGLIAILAAVIAGWWHMRSLKRGSTGAPEPPVAKS